MKRVVCLSSGCLSMLSVALVAVLAPLPAAPAAAQSITTVVPARLLDTRPTGVTVDGEQQAGGELSAGETRTVPVAGRGNVPASGVTAVAVNITAVNPSTSSFVTAFAAGSTRPNASNLNLAAGRTLPNMAIVPLGTGGAISLFNNAGTTHLTMDLMGWFGSTGDYIPGTPSRLMDTRPTGATVDGAQVGAGTFGAATTRTLPIAGRGGVPIAGVSAVVLNVTGISPTGPSFVTVFPSGTTRPNASNLNLSAGQNVPNMVVVQIGANGAVDIFNNANTTHLAVDVMGWFAGGGDYTTVVPGRILDSRTGGVTVDGEEEGEGVWSAGETRRLPVAGRANVPLTGVAAVAVNITAVNPSTSSFVTAFPAGTTRPGTSNLNLAAGRNLPNMAIVPLGVDGSIDLFNNAGTTHLVVDVVGWFPPDPAPATALVSRRIDNVAHRGFFAEVDVARDGGFVAFSSIATNLVPSDTNGVTDIFVADLETLEIERVSVADDESQLTAESIDPAISDDGRFVSWRTASAAVAGDVNGVLDVFRRDRQTGETIRISLQNDESPYIHPSTEQDMNGSGNVIAFNASTGAVDSPTLHAFVRDVNGGTTEQASLGATNFSNGAVTGVSVSDDGDKVAVTKQETGAQHRSHIFRYDVSANTLMAMTSTQNGTASPTLSGSSPVLSDSGAAVLYRRSFTLAMRFEAGGLEKVVAADAQTVIGHSFAGSTTNVLFSTDEAFIGADTNNNFDVYLANTSGTVAYTRVSVTSGGGQSSGGSVSAGMSSDQSRVVFSTSGTDLTPGGLSGDLANLVLKEGASYSLLSTADPGESAHGASFAPTLTPDGRFVVYRTTAQDIVVPEFDNFTDVVRLDRATGAVVKASVGNGSTDIDGAITGHDVSADGNRVVFVTSAEVQATNLDRRETTFPQVFVRDIAAGTTTAVSHKGIQTLANGFNQEAAISGDGRFVVFFSTSSDLVSGDTNGKGDVFVRDLTTGVVERVSVKSDESQITGATTDFSMTPAISHDGRYVTWTSTAPNIVPGVTTVGIRVYCRDRLTGTTDLVAAGQEAVLSDDGRFVSFSSFDSTLVPNDTNGTSDVFVKDMTTGVITRVSLASGGAQASGGDSGLSNISGNGRWVTFASNAANLVAGDSNGVSDVFVHDRSTGTTTRVSLAEAGGQAVGVSQGRATITEAGRFVVFDSEADNLVAGDVNPGIDVFLRDLG